jgi:flagellin-like hook-associated protein FlgL
MIKLSINSLYSPINLLNSSLKKNTNSLTTAMQRLSTGCKINSAKDDAAGLSLSSALQKQIYGNQQGYNNIQMGLGLLNTADSAFNDATKIVERLKELSTQAANGLYSSSERAMMQNEADQLLKSLYGIKGSTDYNGKKILKSEDIDSSANSQPVTRITEQEAIAKGYVVIKSAADFVSKIIPWGAGTAGKTFILMDNIDMSAITNYSKKNGFKGTFDGNGYTISNLTLNTNATRAGLFGNLDATSVVKNLTLDNFDVTGAHGTGALAGEAFGGCQISNCNVTNTNMHSTTSWLGGLVGMSYGVLT